MKSIVMKLPMLLRTTALVAAASFLLTTTSVGQTVAKPQPAPPGAWTVIGSTVADYDLDHDSILIRGRFDHFSKIMFKVTEAPLHMHRVVVTYENGQPDEIPVKEKIKKGGESRAIDLRGEGMRGIRRIDFWYDTRGSSGERAVVTVFGKK